MLIKLPNGDWVNPQDVVSVRMQGAITGRRVRLMSRVIVTMKDGSRPTIKTVLEDTATTLRDQIAEQVNTACVIGGQRC